MSHVLLPVLAFRGVDGGALKTALSMTFTA